MHANALYFDLPHQRHKLERKIDATDSLPSPLRQAILDALSTLPDGDRICHGDFHSGNILLTPDRAVIIDWIDTSHGNPHADVTRTTILTLGAAANSQVPVTALKVFVHLFHSGLTGPLFPITPRWKSRIPSRVASCGLRPPERKNTGIRALAGTAGKKGFLPPAIQ